MSVCLRAASVCVCDVGTAKNYCLIDLFLNRFSVIYPLCRRRHCTLFRAVAASHYCIGGKLHFFFLFIFFSNEFDDGQPFACRPMPLVLFLHKIHSIVSGIRRAVSATFHIIRIHQTSLFISFSQIRLLLLLNAISSAWCIYCEFLLGAENEVVKIGHVFHLCVYFPHFLRDQKREPNQIQHPALPQPFFLTHFYYFSFSMFFENLKEKTSVDLKNKPAEEFKMDNLMSPYIVAKPDANIINSKGRNCANNGLEQ